MEANGKLTAPGGNGNVPVQKRAPRGMGAYAWSKWRTRGLPPCGPMDGKSCPFSRDPDAGCRFLATYRKLAPKNLVVCRESLALLQELAAQLQAEGLSPLSAELHAAQVVALDNTQARMARRLATVAIREAKRQALQERSLTYLGNRDKRQDRFAKLLTSEDPHELDPRRQAHGPMEPMTFDGRREIDLGALLAPEDYDGQEDMEEGADAVQ